MGNIFDIFKKIEKENSNAAGPVQYLIVGLGNSDEKYKNTRHNTGFMFLDFLAQKLNIEFNKNKFKSLVATGVINDKKVLLIKPQTYMNLSGEAVKLAADFYKIKPENIIVIFDDISLEIGKLRIRPKGSAGGHNGIKNIIEQLGDDKFPRIKIGIGDRNNKEMDLKDYVLSNFSNEEMQKINSAIGKASLAIELIIDKKIEKAMNLYN